MLFIFRLLDVLFNRWSHPLLRVVSALRPDVHMRTFNVTPDSQLNYDMDILIVARHFNSPFGALPSTRTTCALRMPVRRLQRARCGGSVPSTDGFHHAGREWGAVGDVAGGVSAGGSECDWESGAPAVHRGAGVHVSVPGPEDVRPDCEPRLAFRLTRL